MAVWKLDHEHSEIEFRVRHMMISTVKGQFGSFDVTLQSESENLSNASIYVSVDVASIRTKNDQRDAHLKGEDFFNVELFPKITFKSTSVTKKSADEFSLIGDLTIKNSTQPVTLDVELGGVAKDPWGNEKVGYTVVGKINRSDFGLSYNAALETGGVMVSEEVKFSADIQFVKS